MLELISQHFTWDDITRSSTAERLKINNKLPILLNERVAQTARALEMVRATLGCPITIDSWYRCEKLNAAIGGSAHSAHMDGYAVDFIAPKFGTPLEIVKAIIASGIKFDQLIQEGSWVHVSFDPRMRQETLTAKFGSVGVTYVKGV